METRETPDTSPDNGSAKPAKPAKKPATPRRPAIVKPAGSVPVPGPEKPPAGTPGKTASKDIPSPAVIVEPVTADVTPPYREDLPKSKEIQGAITNQSALVILALLDGIASMLWGSEAMMTPPEREMLSAPLERILSRMEFAQTEAVKKMTDPILLIMGLVAWGSRISRQQAAKKPKETPIQASQRPAGDLKPVSSNGTPPAPARIPEDVPTYSAASDIQAAMSGPVMTTEKKP